MDHPGPLMTASPLVDAPNKELQSVRVRYVTGAVRYSSDRRTETLSDRPFSPAPWRFFAAHASSFTPEITASRLDCAVAGFMLDAFFPLRVEAWGYELLIRPANRIEDVLAFVVMLSRARRNHRQTQCGDESSLAGARRPLMPSITHDGGLPSGTLFHVVGPSRTLDKERRTAGSAWQDCGLAFTTPPGGLSTRPTSPAASAASSIGPTFAASASTTSGTRPPPCSWSRGG